LREVTSLGSVYQPSTRTCRNRGDSGTLHWTACTANSDGADSSGTDVLHDHQSSGFLNRRAGSIPAGGTDERGLSSGLDLASRLRRCDAAYDSKHNHPADHAEVVLGDLSRNIVDSYRLQSEPLNEVDYVAGRFVPRDSFLARFGGDSVELTANRGTPLDSERFGCSFRPFGKDDGRIDDGRIAKELERKMAGVARRGERPIAVRSAVSAARRQRSKASHLSQEWISDR
jgi:hypothetical protein